MAAMAAAPAPVPDTVPATVPDTVPEARPAAAPVVAPAPLSEDNLKQSLNEAGLQWVQTDPGKAVSEAAPEPAPKLGRAPRKTTDTAPQEPLVMVETRQNNS